ncbi:MAG: DUF2726 domain-containing protein [Azoarcus sp.]|jgi:hypothetical protein|nr:DUF2726 domain-containing protein [Azoarcus sp.]
MSLTIFVCIVVVAVVAIILFRNLQLQKRRRQQEAAWFAATLKDRSGTFLPDENRGPVRARPVLLDAAEARLLAALAAAFPKMAVFCHVGFARILVLSPDARELAAFTADFLICKQSDAGIAPTAAIELDNPGARPDENRQNAFTQKQRALAEAGIPLLRYAAAAPPDVEALRRDVANAIVAQSRAAKTAGKRT